MPTLPKTPILLLLSLFTLSFARLPSGVIPPAGFPHQQPPSHFLLRQTQICPSGSQTCPSRSLCCPKDLCCPRSLPFCLTPDVPDAPSFCGTADAKVQCTISTGEILVGTLCASDPTTCCPFPGFQRCASEGPLRCVNERGFVRCVVDGESLPGVVCDAQGDTCCPNPSRCCEDGGCCDVGTGGAVAVEGFPSVVLGVEGVEDVEDVEGSGDVEDDERKRCKEFGSRRERRRCVRLRKRQRRICLICRKRGKEECDEICQDEVIV